MKITNLKKLKPKKLIAFDMDGTLTPSKSKLQPDMAKVFGKLLETHKLSITSGGSYQTFQKQFLPYLDVPKSSLKNLSIFPTCGSACYVYKSGWKKVYSLNLTAKEKSDIRKAFARIFKEINYIHPSKVYGEIIEDRKSSMAFSPLGQEIVTHLGSKGLKMKEQWREKYDPVRFKIAKLLSKYLPTLEVRVGGVTTIDITRKGIDKAYAVKQMEKQLKIKIKDMLFIGDAIYPHGNDYAVTKTPIDYMKVDGPVETKKILQAILESH